MWKETHFKCANRMCSSIEMKYSTERTRSCIEKSSTVLELICLVRFHLHFHVCLCFVFSSFTVNYTNYGVPLKFFGYGNNDLVSHKNYFTCKIDDFHNHF